VPLPELLFTGDLEDTHVTCERRLAGRTAPELSDDPPVGRRLLADAARIAAALLVAPARPLDEADFEALVTSKLDLVLRHARVASTLARTRELRARARDVLLGRPLPRVLYHADLRGKHVQIAPTGEVLGILDWGTLEDVGLPYVDLFHLAVHERKQAEHLTAGDAWRRVRAPDTRLPREAAALDAYAASLALDEPYLRLIEDLYPLLVGAMAERNWDYSRPRWVHEQFAL
jgi:aminoglycoside phosphotransferase (APT) family kinase protein